MRYAVIVNMLQKSDSPKKFETQKSRKPRFNRVNFFLLFIHRECLSMRVC